MACTAWSEIGLDLLSRFLVLRWSQVSVYLWLLKTDLYIDGSLSITV